MQFRDGILSQFLDIVWARAHPLRYPDLLFYFFSIPANDSPGPAKSGVHLMQSKSIVARRITLAHIVWMGIAALVLATLGTSRAFAANYPLEITNIKPSGQLPATHRHYRAYPGIEYNIRAAVIGGDFPYVYSLANAPAGMTINADTGEIRWPNPQANASPTITVRDRVGISVNATWTINVSTSGFKFVDAVNGSSSGSGSISSPWRTLRDVWNNAATTDVIYFRAGSYNQLDIPERGDIGGDWEGIVWENKPSIWLAYPGDTRPIIDFGFVAGQENAPLIRLNSDYVYVDGFEIRRVRNIGFQFPSGIGGRHGPTYRRLVAHGLGPSTSGSNAAFIMTTTFEGRCTGGVIQDSEFYDFQASIIKIYSQHKLLIEDNYIHDGNTGIELKDLIEQFTVRGNRFRAISIVPLGGNMHETATSGEILFNLIQGNQYALRLNNDAMATSIWTYRNTFSGGEVMVAHVTPTTGPFTFNNNVIVNNETGNKLTVENNSAPARLIVTNNLTGTPGSGIVDSSGNLIGANTQYIGIHGHMRGAAGPRPNPPTSVTVRP
jgi:hypothetical protein